MTRQRPEIHFTASHGWTNDPHGIIHYRGQYHMFFQYNPAGLTWDRACHWGHATSPDLLHWTEAPVALAPESEIGCWSGSAVVEDDVVTILYTTIRHEDLGRGAVALAQSSGDLAEWVRVPGPDVIDGPPTELDVVAFRDPYVWRDGSTWKAVLGAGLVGFGGTALQYSSPNLSDWSFDGVVASRANAEREGVWTGKVWECPQLVQIGDAWVMTVSVWEDDVLHYVAYAVGSYDGVRFTPLQWARFSWGPIAYATSLFRDESGRAHAMSWLRETDNTAPAGSDWASAISAPFMLQLDGNELIVRHHGNLRAAPSEPVQAPMRVEGAFLLAMEGDLAGTTVALDDQEAGLRLTIASDRVQVWSAHALLLEMPASRPGPAQILEVSIDADILEATWSSCPGVGSIRIPAVPERIIKVESTSECTAELHRCR